MTNFGKYVPRYCAMSRFSESLLTVSELSLMIRAIFRLLKLLSVIRLCLFKLLNSDCESPIRSANFILIMDRHHASEEITIACYEIQGETEVTWWTFRCRDW